MSVVNTPPRWPSRPDKTIVEDELMDCPGCFCSTLMIVGIATLALHLFGIL
jgi:hypothetical protein